MINTYHAEACIRASATLKTYSIWLSDREYLTDALSYNTLTVLARACEEQQDWREYRRTWNRLRAAGKIDRVAR